MWMRVSSCVLCHVLLTYTYDQRPYRVSFLNVRRQYVYGSVFNGKFAPPSWGSAADGHDTFKMQFGNVAMNIKGIDASVANGVKGSIIVDASVTLSQLSVAYPNQLYYAIFSVDGKYCPQGYAYPPSS